ncbi:MAG: hypothetical protein SGCHY_003152 [Lobulomycetales sp.]
MSKSLRILLAGDSGTGKSSLVTSLVSELFHPDIQHVVPEITIPPEWSGNDNASTHIVDSSARIENRDQLDVEVRKADVIGRRNVPVVLVGNKKDLADRSVLDHENTVIPVMAEFKQVFELLLTAFKVETCVECSAKERTNVSEVFYFCQRAVLYPTAPLYDSREQSMKPACVDALSRIFTLSDKDRNGFLGDQELNDFQRKCFSSPLQRQELEGVKETGTFILPGVTIDAVRQGDASFAGEKGLSKEGFIYLNTVFIQKGRLETTWQILRSFGYGQDLTLREDFLVPPSSKNLLSGEHDEKTVYSKNGTEKSRTGIELSRDGYAFFTELFQTFDADKDGALNEQELEQLFSTAPPGNPFVNSGFPNSTITNGTGWVTLQGFLAQWSMTTLMDYKTTLAYLAYLGYPDADQTSALKRVTRSSTSVDYSGWLGLAAAEDEDGPSVFLVYVFGAPGSGKTSLLRAFVDKSFLQSPGSSSPEKRVDLQSGVVNSVEIHGGEKYLVMQEFGQMADVEVLESKGAVERADLVCLVYDSADANSFSYVADIWKKYDFENSYVPCVFVSTKSDLELEQQRYVVQPDVFCRQHGLPVPISVSIKEKMYADVFQSLVGVAVDPGSALPGSLIRRQRRAVSQRRALLGVGAVGALIFALVIYKLKN